MIRIALSGASGRMGQEISSIVAANPTRYALELKFSLENPISNGEQWLADVLIDFSLPENIDRLLKAAKAQKIPCVIGTTGLSADHHKALLEASASIPILYSANMSLGVAVLSKLLRQLQPLQHFDFQVEEFHHNRKKDKPSGTAILLQKSLEQGVGKQAPDPVCIRGGGIFGIHRVYCMSESEVISFEHQALSRAVFAEGALKAAAWLAAVQKPGLYSFENVIG